MGISSFQVKSQSRFYVKLQDGNIQDYTISLLQKITFSETELQLSGKDGNTIVIGMDLISLMSFNEFAMLDMESIDTGETQVAVYPNPAYDYIYIRSLADTEILVSICDLKGSLIKEVRVFTPNPIDVSSLSKGIYLIKINGKVSKFIKL